MKKLLSFLLVFSMILSFGLMSAFAAEEELSDDLYDFQVMIDGELYQFPMSFADFEAMGWKYGGDETKLIAPWQSSSVETFTRGDLKIYTRLFNLGINTVPLSESMVAGVNVEKYYYDQAPGTEIVFPGGLVFGEATLDDLTAAYGSPDDDYENDMYTKVTYDQDYYESWDFYVYAESGVVEEFEVTYVVADEDAIAADLALVTDAPIAEVTSYVAPTELGDDPFAWIVEFDGVLYQMPAPISQLIENGWELDKDSPSVIYGADYEFIDLKKDGETLHGMANNYNPNATVTENCFMTLLESDEFGPEVDITIPTGVTIGMSAEDVEAALGDIDYEIDDDSSYFIYYSIEDPSDSWNEIEIRVDKETGAVVAISVDYDPDELPYEVIPLEDNEIVAEDKGDSADEDIVPADDDGGKEEPAVTYDSGEVVEPGEDGYADGYMGDTMRTYFFDFTVNEAYLTDEYEGYAPSEGNELLVVDMTVYNHNLHSMRSVEMYDSDFQTQWNDTADDAFALPVTFEREGYPNTGTEPVGDMLAAVYNVGIHQSVDGVLVFEVPAGNKDFTVSYREYFADDTYGDSFWVYFTPAQK